MKVLLTGATGFVGSHILDCLRQRGVDSVVFLRASSNRRFIEARLPEIEVRQGAVDDPASLVQAMRDVTHVIHCAGAVKALRNEGFFQTNEAGTRHLVEAANQFAGRIQRVVHVSSLAAAGPSQPGRPRREEDAPRPVSAYGKSKLAAEHAVRERCRTEFVILRPPAVYGPRDTEFLRLFKAIRSHVRPRFGGGRQALSLVYVEDLARVAVECLTHPGAANETFFVAGPEVVTAGELAAGIAAAMRAWTLPLPLPTALLWPVCVMQEAVSRLTGRPNVLTRQKYAELAAPAWVCDASRLKRRTALECPSPWRAGIGRTLQWYQENGWL